MAEDVGQIVYGESIFLQRDIKIRLLQVLEHVVMSVQRGNRSKF